MRSLRRRLGPALLLGALAVGCSAPESNAELTAAPQAPTASLQRLALRLAPSERAAVQQLGTDYQLGTKGRGTALRLQAGSGGFELHTSSGALQVHREGALVAELSEREGVVQQLSAAPGVAAAFFARGDGVEELIHVADREAFVGYRFEHARGVRLRVVAGPPPVLEIADSQGLPLARAAFPATYDARDRLWPVGLETDGNRLRVTVPAEAEFPVIVDPIWIRPQAMSTPRFRHTATLLLDGKVLVVGGSDTSTEVPGWAGSALTSAELFDERTRSFEAVGSLTDARWGHTATLLRDGRVLVLGGMGAEGEVLEAAEVYDPESKTFSPIGTLGHARALHTATLLPDERVLIVGGVSGPEREPVPMIEGFVVDEGRAEDLQPWSDLTSGHAAALMADGTVTVAWAGQATLGEFTDQLLYPFYWRSFDPAVAGVAPASTSQGSWFPRYSCVDCEADVLMSRSGILGGLLARTGVVNWIFGADPPRVFYQPELSVAGGVGAATASAATGVMQWFLGGRSGGGNSGAVGSWNAANGELFNAYQPSLLSARAWPTATTLPGGAIFVAGGLGALGPLSSTELLSPDPAVRNIAFEPGLARIPNSTDHAQTLLLDGKVLITGGWETPSASSTLSLPVSVGEEPTLTPLGALRAKRALHQSLLLPDGNVLIAGGKTDSDQAEEELFDAKSGETRELGFRLHARGSGLMLAGDLAIFAGKKSVQIVDTTRWSRTNLELSEPPGCDAPALARLANGHVLLVGAERLVELDPHAVSEVRSVPLDGPRCEHLIAALPDRTVMVAGGVQAGSEPSVLAARYSTLDGSVTGLDELPQGVSGGTTFFEANRVLLHGREGASLSFNPVEGTFQGPIFAEAEWRDRVIATRLAQGGVLMGGRRRDVLDLGEIAPFRTFGSAQPLPANWAEQPLEVTPGTELELEDLSLSKTWPENSGGTTAGSATNAPVAVWIPAVGGWPVEGTFTRWSERAATWRVPRTAFPGLGILFYSISGTLHPLRMVRMQPLKRGAACEEGGECASGYCTDGVCCDSVCDGTCQACTNQLKGRGKDGACEAVTEGLPDIACELSAAEKKTPNPCGRTGSCGADGACGAYPEGQSCGDDDARCVAGVCTRQLSNDPPAVDVCDGDHTVTLASGRQVECEDNLRCSLSDNRCLPRCDTNVDCVRGFVCDAAGECREPFVAPRESAGCAPGCRIGRDAGTRSALALACCLVAALVVRRGRRARATNRFAP